MKDCERGSGLCYSLISPQPLIPLYANIISFFFCALASRQLCNCNSEAVFVCSLSVCSGFSRLNAARHGHTLTVNYQSGLNDIALRVFVWVRVRLHYG